MEAYMKKTAALLAVLFIIPFIIFAKGDYGTPGEFLNWGAGARSLAMGKAFTALADDPSAIYYNPAGLAQQNPIQIALQHVFLFEDTMYDFAAATYPISGIGTFGFGYVRLGSMNFDARDEQWTDLGKFDIADQAFILSYGREITNWFALGLNIKVVNQANFEVSSTGFGIDTGVIWTPSNYISFGLSVINALPPTSLKLIETAETYPVILKGGVALKLFGDRVMPAMDVEQEFGGRDFKFRMGIEIYPFQQLALRAGLDETEVAFGAGFFWRPVRLDYAIGFGDLGYSNRLTLTFAFGGFDINLSADPKIFSPVGTRRTTTVSIYAETKYPIEEWEMNIINEDGDVVRSYSGNEKPPKFVTWDGKDDRGLPVSDGEYKCVMKVKDKTGRTLESNTESVKISSSIPTQPGTIQLEE
jgi:hypothetical protein